MGSSFIQPLPALPDGKPRAPLAAALLALETPPDPFLVLLLAALVLTLAWLALANHRRAEKLQRKHLQALHEREQRLRLALWASNELYWQYCVATHALERIVVSPEANDDLPVLLLDQEPQIHPDDLPQLQDRLRNYLRGNTPFFLSEHRMLDSNGQWEWIRACGRSVAFDAQGRVTYIAGTARNIDSRLEMESQSEIASEVMRCMAESVAVLDTDFHFVSVNPAFSRMTGYTSDDVIGRDTALLDGNQHDPDFHQAARAAILTQDSWEGEMWQRRKDGTDFLCAMRCNTIIEPGTQRRLFVLVANDITERRRIEKELRYLANYDALTNLPNRSLLSERLSHAIVQARRHGQGLALLFLDLDNFKDINDSLGHATGDRVLRAVAQRLQETVGGQRTVARVSGDEFVVILDNLDTPTAATDCAQRIITAFDQPLRIDNRYEFTTSPSIGISLFPEHAQVPTDLLKHADTAMYRAKTSGKRGFMLYASAMDDDIRRRSALIAALRRAIENNELHLAFQPQMQLTDGRIDAVEALLRWTHPVFGTVSPTEFIPLAEESGLIFPIGEWVLRTACRTRMAWQQQGVDPRLMMSVNVSSLQLQRSDLQGTVRKILDETGLLASQLELEITESVLMGNAELASQKLHAFRSMGVSIAVDDFGTGYSSLAYLHRLPINTLKIDKVFVDGLAAPNDNEDTIITPTIIAMAHALGLKVVAEGVETAGQLAFLKQAGCDTVQGYWLARPLSADACLAHLNETAAASSDA